MRLDLRLAAALGLPLSALALSACGVGERAPGDGSGDERIGAVQQAVPSCPGGGQPFDLPCYRDLDGDGRGAGPLVTISVCSGTCTSNGYAYVNGDCNDSSASRWQNLSCYTDSDGDGYVTSATPATVCAGATCESVPGKVSDDGDGVDCDDTSPARFRLHSCFVDADGDHFGAGASVSTCAGRHCLDGTSGVAYNSGDCDDTNASIHPQLLETHGDGVDNDCENGVDQAEFYFDHPDVSANTSTSITLTARLRHTAERTEALAGNLSAKIYYKNLEQASADWVKYPSSGTTPMSVLSCSAGGLCRVRVTLPGLDPLSVYMADLELFRTGDGTRIYPHGKTSMSSECGHLQPWRHCFNTDTLYSMTKGQPGPLRDARWGIVMTALDRYGKFRNTDMGYWNMELAYELELAARDSAYCSEFYAAAAKDYLVDMNPCDYQSAGTTPQCDPGETSDAERWVPYVREWFDAYGASQSYEYLGPGMSALKPGDWLGVNPNKAEPDGQHTQMFLAWDAATNEYWYIEGNGGITATWNANSSAKYSHSINVHKHHHCDDGAPTDATCGADDYYVQRVGKLSAAMVE